MEYIGFLIIVAILLLFFFISGIINERKSKKNYINNLIKNYGLQNTREYNVEGFQNISAYFRHHKTDFSIDDITWNDLNMNEIFRQMNYAKSSAGDEYLYYLLRSPRTTAWDWGEFENKVEYFRTHQPQRLKLQLVLHKMGYTGKYSLYDYLDNLDSLEKRNSTKDILADIMLILSIVIMFADLGKGLVFFFIMIFYNVTTYFKEKAVVDPYITSFRYLFRILNEVKELKKIKLTAIHEEVEKLSGLAHKLNNFTRFSYLLMSGTRMSGDMMELGLDYIRMFFHLDIIKFNSMVKEVYKNRGQIDEMITIIGKLDTYLCIGEYREYLKEYCVPEYGKNRYFAKELYHPLLSEPVKNDVEVTKSMLITGSNASGKSTFLKTIAVNAILAQSIHTVCADKYVGDYYRIYSSLSLKDNFFEGDSYYMAEIKSIKRILDASVKEGAPVLAFVDEVLRGTNTIERISASSVILQQLAERNGYCFAATHDLELAEMLKNYYENVHFEESIENEDIVFPYRLQKGKATTRNAIALLKIMGYDSRITQTAQNQAERFEINRKWKVLP